MLSHISWHSSDSGTKVDAATDTDRRLQKVFIGLMKVPSQKARFKTHLLPKTDRTRANALPFFQKARDTLLARIGATRSDSGF